MFLRQCGDRNGDRKGSVSMQAERFYKNMIDQVKELQLKLGYAKETVRLYYPASSLNALLGTTFAEDAAGGRALLEAVRQILKETEKERPGLAGTAISLRGDRFELTIPPEGAEYIHQKEKSSPFLQELVTLFQTNHHSTLEEICAVFERASSNGYVCEKMPEEMDFDYVIYFKDALVDEYFYCVKMEMGHTIYLRFMREDYIRSISYAK